MALLKAISAERCSIWFLKNTDFWNITYSLSHSVTHPWPLFQVYKFPGGWNIYIHIYIFIQAFLVAQSVKNLSLCNPVDCSPPGSSVHGIVQARTLEWLPFPPPGDLSDPGIEPASPVSRALQVNSLPLSHRGSPVLYRHINNWDERRMR